MFELNICGSHVEEILEPNERVLVVILRQRHGVVLGPLVNKQVDGIGDGDLQRARGDLR